MEWKQTKKSLLIDTVHSTKPEKWKWGASKIYMNLTFIHKWKSRRNRLLNVHMLVFNLLKRLCDEAF